MNPDYYAIEVRQVIKGVEYGGTIMVSSTFLDESWIPDSVVLLYYVERLARQMDEYGPCTLDREWMCFPEWWPKAEPEEPMSLQDMYDAMPAETPMLKELRDEQP